MRERAGFPGDGVHRIIEHLGNVDFTVLIEGHVCRAHDIRFRGEQFRVEIFAQMHRLQGIRWREGAFLRIFLGAATKQYQYKENLSFCVHSFIASLRLKEASAQPRSSRTRGSCNHQPKNIR